MKKIKSFFKRENDIYIFVIVFTIILFVFGRYRLNKLNKIAIYTIAKYIKSTTGGDGSEHYVNVLINRKIYESTLGNIGNLEKGEYYYIKIDKNNPTGFSKITEIKVPQCIIDSIEYKLPPDGWKEIPKDVCK